MSLELTLKDRAIELYGILHSHLALICLLFLILIT